MDNILDKIKTVEDIEGNLKKKFSLTLNPFPKQVPIKVPLTLASEEQYLL